MIGQFEVMHILPSYLLQCFVIYHVRVETALYLLSNFKITLKIEDAWEPYQSGTLV